MMHKNHRLIEFDDYITPDGKVYNFHNGVDRFLMTFEGTGMPPIDYITQQGPLQHGETVIDYRLAKRVIQYVVRRNACDRYDYWSNRADMLNFFRPNRQTPTTIAPGHLRKRIPGMDPILKIPIVRQIDVFIESGPSFAPRSTEDYDEYGITEALRFIAHDPTFYDPTPIVMGWSLNTYDHLVFPVTLIPYSGYPSDSGQDMVFGTNMIGDYSTCIYTGTWPTYPTITFVGPLSGPIITNITTGKKIQLLYDISGGETVTISLPYGNKTVLNQAGVDLQGTLSDDSDLADFAIEVDPAAPNGLNTILVVGGGAILGTTNVYLEFYTKFIGI
jgi:hypothetical protein